MQLTELERLVLTRIAENEAPEYAAHIPLLVVIGREFTGAGFYTTFGYASPREHLPEKRTLGATLLGRFKELDPEEAGFVVYVDAGQITVLEMFAYGLADWPRSISGFDLAELRTMTKP